MWYNNKKVTMTFCSHHTQNAWAYIDTLGWRKIKPETADGVTNLFITLCAAKANNRLVNVRTNGTNQIDIAYLK